MTEIVILGAGIGGVSAALELRRILRPGERLTVVSDRPYFHFVPSNPWVALGWRRRRQITVDLVSLFARRGIRFEAVGVVRLHPAEKRLDLADGRSLSYDRLVVASGPDLAFDEIDGLGPECGHTHSVCHVDHAEKAFEAWRGFIADPGPVVVGAVQGASCFGPAYEFARMMDSELRRRGIRDKVPITFVTPEPYIGHMGLDGVGDSKGLMEQEFRSHDIKWVTNARVQKVDPGNLHVEEVGADGSVTETRQIPFKYAMLLPGFRGIAALRGIEGLVNPRGFVLVDEYQRNPSYPDVYGVGVCVAIPPVGPTPVPVGVPKTGYMIESMVTAACHNIRATLDGKPVTARASWHAICLADFGDKGVAFVAAPQLAPRNFNWAARGRWVHWAKIAFEAYFLTKIRLGLAEPFFERAALSLMGIRRLKP